MKGIVMISLGINIGHDQGAAVVKDGILIGAIAQERINRIKHSASTKIPFVAIDAILNYLKLNIHDIDCIGFSSTAVNINDLKKYVADGFEEKYCISNIPFIPIAHHQAHAESAYFTSDFSEAITLVADGGGEMIGMKEEAESIFYCKGSDVTLIEQRLQSNNAHAFARPHNYLIPFMNKCQFNDQISLGKKYEQVTCLLSFGLNGAGKTMGLSAYGKSLIDTEATAVTDPFSFNLNFQDILQPYYKIYEKSGENYFKFMKKHRADIARTIQDFTENQVLKIIEYILNKYKASKICLAGGLFLNCPLNHKILESFPNISLHICPASADDGQAIGSAFSAYRTIGPNLKPSSLCLPYLGFEYTNVQIKNSIDERNLKCHYYDTSCMAKIIAELIYKNKIIGFLHGRSEIGPRALCHRSIFANPTTLEMKDYINKKVKHREHFRPFAPVVIAEKQFDFFSLLQESPYMLLASKVKSEFVEYLPAITHVDGSARIQAIKKQTDPYVHKILIEFEKLSGFPILLNTSFNDCGEPIVETPNDAIKTFLTTEIDVLVMENYILFKDEL